jgi:ATP synthase protein I
VAGWAMGNRAIFLNNRIVDRAHYGDFFHAPINPSFLFRRQINMPEFREMYNRQRKWIFYLLSIYVLGWGITSYKTIFLGLILGTIFSYVNLWLLVRKTESFDKAISTGKKVRSLGSLSRMATAGIAVAIALRYPDYFDIISMVIGLMTSYIVIMIDYFYHAIRAHN